MMNLQRLERYLHLLGAALIASGFVAIHPAAASLSSVLDQQQPVVDLSRGGLTVGGASKEALAQTVTAGISGALTEVDLPASCAPGSDLVVKIEAVSAKIPNGIVLASQTVAGSALSGGGAFNRIVFAHPPRVTVGSPFAIVLSSTGDCGVFQGPPGDSYPRGNLFFEALPNPLDVWVCNCDFPGASFDLPFKTFVSRGGPSTLTVCASGCQYTTIAAALDGDTIAVGPGSYSGGFTIPLSVRLIGAGRNVTTISGGGPVVRIARGASVKISKVTISGGVAVNGAGIDNDGSLWLYETRISDNHAGSQLFSAGGGGIFNDGGQLRVEKSSVSGNTAEDGGGIRNEGGTVVVIRSMVSNNSVGPFLGFAPTVSGGGISNTGTLYVVASQLIGNHAESDLALGGGVSNDSAGAVTTIRESWVSDNSADTQISASAGGGLYNGGGSMTLNETIVSRNSAVGEGAAAAGGGIWNDATLSVTNSPLRNNTAHGFVFAEGGGIANFGSALFRKSPISANTASSNADFQSAVGGGIFNRGGLTLLKSPVSGNAAVGFEADGGGIFNYAALFLHRIDSPVTGNTPNNCVGC
jgi:hypothetical protein